MPIETTPLSLIPTPEARLAPPDTDGLSLIPTKVGLTAPEPTVDRLATYGQRSIDAVAGVPSADESYSKNIQALKDRIKAAEDAHEEALKVTEGAATQRTRTDMISAFQKGFLEQGFDIGMNVGADTAQTVRERTIHKYVQAIKNTDVPEDRAAIMAEYRSLMVEEVIGNSTFMGTVQDLAGLIFLPNTPFDSYQFAGSAAPSDVEAVWRSLKELPYEDQIKLLPGILEKAAEVSGTFPGPNRMKAMNLIAGLFDPDNENPWLAIGNVETAVAIAPAIFRVLARVSAASNIPRLTSTVNRELAGKMASDTLFAEKATVPARMAAAETALPWDFQASIGAADSVDGVADVTSLALEERLSRIDAAAKTAGEAIPTQFATFLDKSARIAAKQGADERVTKQLAESLQLVDDAGPRAHIMGAGFAEESEDGFAVVVNLSARDVETAKALRKEIQSRGGELTAKRVGTEVYAKQKVYYSVDDVEALPAANKAEIGRGIGLIKYLFGSPDFAIGKMFGNMVEDATLLEIKESKIYESVRTLLREARGGLTKADAQFVNDALTKFDLRKESYTTQQLLTGDNSLGVKFTEAQTRAYYGHRALTKFTEDALNHLEYKTRLRQGWQSAVIKGDWPKAAMQTAKPVNGLPGHVSRVWDDAEGKAIDLPDAAAKEALAARLKASPNLRLVRLADPMDMASKEKLEYILVEGKAVRALARRQLTPQPGYVPRIPVNASYVGKVARLVQLNGNKVEQQVTKHFFRTRQDAETWVEQTNLADPTAKARWQRSFELDATEKADLLKASYNTLYRGARATETPTLWSAVGEPTEYLAPFEAIDRYVNYVASQLPFNEFRMYQIERFQKTVGDKIVPGGRNILEREVSREMTSPRERLAIKKAQDFLRNVMRIPTRQERAWNDAVASVAEVLEPWSNKATALGKTSELVRKSLMSLAHADPTAAIRAGAFHALLGWFNPAQLFIQMQNAVVAASLVGPVDAARYFGKYLPLHAAMSVAHNDAAIAKIARAAGLDVDEFTGLVKAYDQSGLHWSARSSADYNAARLGYYSNKSTFKDFWAEGKGIVTAGSAKQAGAQAAQTAGRVFGTAAQKGLTFFTWGEQYSRGFSFMRASEKFSAANGGRLPKTLEEVDSVTREAIRTTFNLTRSNRAYWQQGWASIPTQFTQITAKFLENMWPTMFGGSAKFGPSEKARVLLYQLGLFGAGGVPVAGWVANNIIEMTRDEDGKVNEGLATALRGGFYEYLAKFVTGSDVDISSRLSLTTGIGQVIERLASTDGTWKKFVGAAGELPLRVVDAVQKLTPTVAAIFSPEYELTPDEVWGATRELLSVASTFRNFDKAIIMEAHAAVYSRQGTLLFTLEREEAERLALFQAAGFAPKKIRDFYTLKARTFDDDKKIKNTVDLMQNSYIRYLNNQDFSPAQQRNLEVKLSILESSYPEHMRPLIREKFQKAIKEKPNIQALLKKNIDYVTATGERPSELAGNLFTNGE